MFSKSVNSNFQIVSLLYALFGDCKYYYVTKFGITYTLSNVGNVNVILAHNLVVYQRSFKIMTALCIKGDNDLLLFLSFTTLKLQLQCLFK